MLTNLKNLIRNPKLSTTTSPSKKDHGHNSKRAEEQHNNLLNVLPISNHSKTSDEELPAFKELSPRYRIVKKLGEGAFSKVYKAFDDDLNVEVAMKVIEKRSMSSSQLDSILKEISIMRRLDHPNIVKLYNYINTEKRAFIIIEYVSGGELFNQIVKYTYFSEDLSRHIIIQVVKAVDYLHSEVGVVHRDIKPENLLFDKIDFIPNDSVKRRLSDDENKIDEGIFRQNIGGGMVGRVKLADFGLSKILWDSKTKTPCGTASYTAPEIVKDESYSKSVDMWAVGCVLYTLLCGFPPFYDTDPKILTTKVSRGEYTFLSPWWDEISKEAKDLVSHLLTVDPKKRYGPDEILNHPWILNNSEPTNPAPDAPLYQTRSDSVLRFEDTIPSVQLSSHLSPRAEAMKFAFDTGISIQRTGTPLSRILDKDHYFNESDEDETTDNTETEDDDDDNYEESEDDSEFNALPEDSCYKHQPIVSSSPIIKKFHNFKISDLPVTPHHFKKSGRSSASNSKNHKNSVSSQCTIVSNTSTIASKTTISPRTLKPTMQDFARKGSSEIVTSSTYKFKEIDNGFNLRFDDNTLLNRRKIAGSTGCGPAVFANN